MKRVLMAGLAMAGIIVVQMMLSFTFTYQVGETFSKVAISALFYWSIVQLMRAGRVAKEKSERAK